MARILQICNTDFYLTRFLAPLVRSLIARGHKVECICEGHQADFSVLGEGVRVHQVGFPRHSSLMEFARAVREVRKVIRERGFDCVNSHNRNASIVGRIAAWRERVPVNLYTAHGFYFHDAQPAPLRGCTIALEAALAQITDFTLSQSREDSELATKLRFIKPTQILNIGNGIDTVRFSPRFERTEVEAELGLQPSRFRVAALGRIVRGKGFTDLLRAFHPFHDAHPETELMIIGGNIDQDISPFQDEFLREVSERNLTNAVQITGLTNVVECYLACCDVFVLPSYREGMPRALLEAMSMERPSIATRIRGCKEIVVPGETGYLYPAHDIQGLSALLEKVFVARDASAALGRAARQRVVQLYSEEAYVARQVNAIERLCSTSTALSSSSSAGGLDKAQGAERKRQAMNAGEC